MGVAWKSFKNRERATSEGWRKREVLKEGKRRGYRVNKGRKEKGCKKER